jgi:small-conductance mechanosensitive channel
MDIINWLSENWISIVVPIVVFLAFFIVSIWVRKIAFGYLTRWLDKAKWEGSDLLTRTTKNPFFHWCLILGAYVAILVSVLPIESKDLGGKVLASLFIVSLTWTILSLAEKLIQLYVNKLRTPSPPTRIIINMVRIVIIVLAILMIIDLWGAPITPLLLFLAVLILAVVIASRDALLNIFSGLQLTSGDVIKTGDFIKLESGNEGYLVEIGWRNTRIKTLDESIILVPNSKLTQSTVINYGRPLKKATQPFRFYTRLHLKELTGLKATSLSKLLSILKRAPGSTIYYHTHHFLEEHQYLTPEPANDFALWVGDALGDEILEEKLASIDIFQFPTISSLKAKIRDVIREYLLNKPAERVAPEGREFHFIKSISVVLPTPYVAHDLREFVEVLRKVTIYSLYFHIFEARLRLQRGNNDFSIWFRDCLGENDLADKIAGLDHYAFTLDKLRSIIIQQIEKRIK